MTKNKLLFLLCLLLGNYAWGQTALTSTTLASAVDSTQAFIIPASTTGFAAFKIAVVDQEAMLIVAVLPSGTVQVQRGYASSRANAHNAAATVYVGPTNAFLNADPSGACSALNTFSPTINLTTGSQWSCTGGLWSQAAATPAAFNSLNGAVFATGTVQQAMTSAGVNGLSFVYPNYSGTDAPSATRFNSLLGPAISSQANGSHLIDYRYGGTAESTFNWPSDGLISTWFSPYQRLCNWSQAIGATAGVNLYCNTFQANYLSGTFNTNANSYLNKSNLGVFAGQTNTYSNGQVNGMGIGAQCTGLGDCIAFSTSAVDYGGANASGDEGLHAINFYAGQGFVEYKGTIASGGATGATSLTITPTAGSGTQGTGRALIDTTLVYNTGTITSVSGTGLVTVVGSGTAWTASTNTTTSAAITVPGGSTIPGSVTFPVVSAAGMSIGDILVLADTVSYETVKITGISGNNITAVCTQAHSSGSTVADASVAGTQAGNGFEFTADTWTTSGQFGYYTVVQPIRQIWPVVSVTDATHMVIWISGSAADQYPGGATFAGAAYKVYPMALTTDVSNAGPTVSNTLTLMPNAVAWANSNTVELALWPFFKFSMANIQMSKYMPSMGVAASGAGISYNGMWTNNDILWSVTNNTPVANYKTHGGNNFAPAAAFAFTGLARTGLAFTNLPDTAMLTAGCPFNASAVSDCTQNSDTNFRLLQVSANGGTDYIAHNPSTGQLEFVTGGANWAWRVPKINAIDPSVIAGAVDAPTGVGWVSCTQANCASSATTLYTTPAADSLYRADVSVACSTATATATGQVTITYTDVSATVQTFTSTTATCTTLGAASVGTATVAFSAKASTAIQYSVTQANAPAGLRVRVAIFQESTN